MSNDKARRATTGREVRFGEEELIVSKTDAQGRITYCNDVFIRISGYAERELLGAPHSLIRHRDMPRAVFKLMWDTIASGEECFAYVVNRAKSGDHYWVLAHVTPTLDASGCVVGYHSNRRAPSRDAIDAARDVYAQVLAAEEAQPSARLALEAGEAALRAAIGRTGLSYPSLVFALGAA